MELKAIGGYFELENRFESEYHIGMLRLNTGRNCLEYILRARNTRKVYLPAYSCNSFLEPIRKLQLDFEYYPINESFEMVSDMQLSEDESILLINYFGLKGKYVKSICTKYTHVIVDNTQAFFESPVTNIDTFYSARKFFGVPDGAYLSTTKFILDDFSQEVSWNRCEHLLRRLENNADDGYLAYLNNENFLSGRDIKYMSELSYHMMRSINYEWVQTRRNQNYQYLHLKLRDYNEINLYDSEIDGPMAYPLFIDREGIRDELIRNKIYVATYWPEILKTSNPNSWEYKLADRLLILPVDQRYGLLDMDRICKVITSLL